MKLTTRQLTLCAVLTALALALSYTENLLPLSLAVPLPGVKLGLANIVTVFALYALGPGQALLILLARCTLGAVFAGNLNALLFSLFGGLLARGLGVTTSSTALPGGIGYSFSPKRSRPIPESVYCQITSSACPRFSPSHTYERLVVSSCPQLVSIACSRSVRSEKNNE